MIPRSKAPLLLLAVAIVIAIAALFLPPIPQPQAYHNFADHRPWLGIPNFGDVASNLPFAIVGLCGLIFLRRPRPEKFADPRERWLYLIMFAALILTAFGSAYYHLAPGDARLVWDRIPIMIVFMAMLAAVIAERVSVNAGLWLFPILQAAGIGSVLLSPENSTAMAISASTPPCRSMPFSFCCSCSSSPQNTREAPTSPQ